MVVAGRCLPMVVGYSKATGKSFRAWLRKRYRNDVAALRKAWADAAVTFENAAVPASRTAGKKSVLTTVLSIPPGWGL